jgi:hypothetical protein
LYFVNIYVIERGRDAHETILSKETPITWDW